MTGTEKNTRIEYRWAMVIPAEKIVCISSIPDQSPEAPEELMDEYSDEAYPVQTMVVVDDWHTEVLNDWQNLPIIAMVPEKYLDRDIEAVRHYMWGMD